MADSDIAKWNAGTAVERAEVNRTGPGWDQSATFNDRSDSTSHLPINAFVGPFAPIPPPEAAPPTLPTESELRERLKLAIEAKRTAEQAMVSAREAHERGLQHANRCQTAVARYVGLDDDIDRHTVDQLRGAEGKAQLSDALRARVVERDLAAIELAAAERAAATLLRELSHCIERNKQAEAAVSLATDVVLHVGQDRLRQPLNALRRRVAAFEQAISMGRHFELWSPVVTALHHDPLGASIDITVPDEPLPVVIPSRPPIGPVLVKLAKPVGREHEPDVVLPLEEMTRLQRAQTKPGNAAVAEFEATERAARLARGI